MYGYERFMNYGTMIPGDTIFGEVYNSGDFGVDEFISEVVFNGCTFDVATLEALSFNDCKFNQCTFSGTVLLNTHFFECDFEECTFDTTTWTECTLDTCSFTECDISNPFSFMETSIEDCKFYKSRFTTNDNPYDDLTFKNCLFFSCTIDDWNLQGLRFIDCEFKSCGLNECRFYKMDLIGCSFNWSILQKCTFDAMISERCRLRRSRFISTVFTKTAKIHDAVLCDTELVQCQFPPEIFDSTVVEPYIDNESRESLPSLTPQTYVYANTGTQKTTKKPVKIISKYRPYRFMTAGV